MKVDYLIVGSGLTGATIARVLKDSGKEILVVDRRSHLGGNVHDQVHSESGIRFHTYGPHYFRTSSPKIWDYVNRFSNFYRYEAVIKSFVDRNYENWPISASYLKRTVGENWKAGFTKGVPKNFEDASLTMMPRVVYEKFVKGYTEKQWGVSASSLSKSLATRFDVRENDDPRLKLSKYQGIPILGYTSFMKNMLSDIDLKLNFDYLKNKDEIEVKKKLIFTGPIDEYFNFSLGKLRYRGQHREHYYDPMKCYTLVCGQLNNPNPNSDYIRALEWKHMLTDEEKMRAKGTLITTETPFSPTDPNEYEYPFPSEENKELYLEYKKMADSLSNVLICGRLGEYRYFDMDQAIARALLLANKINK